MLGIHIRITMYVGQQISGGVTNSFLLLESGGFDNLLLEDGFNIIL